ncbi:hypothetical protein SUGI_0301820 [Cryptomeria japonica]|nr:hypothetical protein SUGI_0301820 [Cryptomeria japonica]
MDYINQDLFLGMTIHNSINNYDVFSSNALVGGLFSQVDLQKKSSDLLTYVAFENAIKEFDEGLLAQAMNAHKRELGVVLCHREVKNFRALDDDPVHPVPSAADRVAHGLGPVAVTVCKPLAFKVSADTEKEIIHNSSVFESHGLICRFQGFWPSLP